MYDVWTSRSVNWDSNLSMTMDIWAKEAGGGKKGGVSEERRREESEGAYALKVHVLHGPVHSLNDAGHRAGDLKGRRGKTGEARVSLS